MGNLFCVTTPIAGNDNHQTICCVCGDTACCARFYHGKFCCSKASACLCCWNKYDTRRLEPKLRKLYEKSESY